MSLNLNQIIENVCVRTIYSDIRSYFMISVLQVRELLCNYLKRLSIFKQKQKDFISALYIFECVKFF